MESIVRSWVHAEFALGTAPTFDGDIGLKEQRWVHTITCVDGLFMEPRR